MRRLERTLKALDGRGYKAYKEIRGSYEHPRLSLLVDHVQGDPFAAPSRLRVVVPWRVAGLPPGARASIPRERAARDFIARAFRRAARRERDVTIDAGGQTVLERSACLFTDEGVELRFRVSLPARGRRVLGRKAAILLCEAVPRMVLAAATAEALDPEALERHCAVVEDQVVLRAALDGAGLVAFLADGSLLPRRSGIDDRPATGGVPVEAPASLSVTLTAPNAGPLIGLGIPRGITLVVGGGFHGKSTLLRALEMGIYDHLPGDGRERVVADPTATKIRAEDGRAVSGVDISPFIDNLPGGRSTAAFTTELASGSTSQAASLVEALEAGARTLLLDEDTSATNFMIRDRRMQALVAKESEPITPFVDRIRELRDRLGVSTVLVMGGSGDYFDRADTVIQMDAYRPRDVTARAREVAARHVTGREEERDTELAPRPPRRLAPTSLDAERKPGRVKLQARGVETLVFGRGEIDLRAVEHLVDPSQLRAIGWLLVGLGRSPDGRVEPVAALAEALARLRDGGWDDLSGQPDGDFALPRLQEVMAALSRLRGVGLGR